MQPLLSPGLDVVQPMVGLGEEMSHPEHRYPAQAEAHPIAVGGEVGVQQGLHPHPFQLGQQQGDVVDMLIDDGESLGHAEILPQFSKPLLI
jgi:hypothetical protein